MEGKHPREGGSTTTKGMMGTGAVGAPPAPQAEVAGAAPPGPPNISTTPEAIRDEMHDEEEDDGSEGSSRGGGEDDEELGGEYPSDSSSDYEIIEPDDSYYKYSDRPVEDRDFEDKEDREAFGGTNMSKCDYFHNVLPLKHNDKKLTEFSIDGNTLISNEAWARLGMFLGRNTHLREIDINGCNLTATKLAMFFGSWPGNNSLIEVLSLANNPIGSEAAAALKPFFNTSSSLTHLVLDNTHLGPEGTKLLSLELLGLPSLTYLQLRNNKIGDEGLEGISMLCFSALTHLRLAGNGIGRRGCEKLTDLLQSDESSLIELDLASNAIDNEGAEILARSLENNTSLEVLCLIGNDTISCVGWESFRSLVCDTSSLNATYGSNHNLRTIHRANHRFRAIHPLPQQLERALRDNGRSGTLHNKACRKLIDHHFKNGNDPGPLLDMDVKLMTYIIRWINRCSDEDFGDGCRSNFMYQVLRTLNVRAFVRKDIFKV